jgi:EAL and modified HD-GYP domain-containing signal transduction protein
LFFGAHRLETMQTLDIGTPTASTNQIAIARQPIVDAQRLVVAYELFHRSPHAPDNSRPAQTPLVLNALVGNGLTFSSTRTDWFFGCPHNALSGPHWDLVDPARTVIDVHLVHDHVPEHIAGIAPLLHQLRKRGFRLAFEAGAVSPLYQPWHCLADFVRVAPSDGDRAPLPALLKAIATRTGATVLADGIDSAAQFDLFQSLGVKLFQGRWFHAPEVVQSRTLSPVEANALKLFNMVRKDTTSVEAVELLLKKDAELGVGLLRIINSAAMGARQKVTSLGQAVQLMGYQKLGRWAAMLMTSASHSSTSLLGASSVVRGRMMELLAQYHLPDEQVGTAFLAGLLSQMDNMLGSPMAVALQGLDLDPEIRAALVDRAGQFGMMLNLVVACEAQDDQAYAEAFARLNYSNHQVNMAHLEALMWCDNVS